MSRLPGSTPQWQIDNVMQVGVDPSETATRTPERPGYDWERMPFQPSVSIHITPPSPLRHSWSPSTGQLTPSSLPNASGRAIQGRPRPGFINSITPINSRGLQPLTSIPDGSTLRQYNLYFAGYGSLRDEARLLPPSFVAGASRSAPASPDETPVAMSPRTLVGGGCGRAQRSLPSIQGEIEEAGREFWAMTELAQNTRKKAPRLKKDKSKPKPASRRDRSSPISDVLHRKERGSAIKKKEKPVSRGRNSGRVGLVDDDSDLATVAGQMTLDESRTTTSAHYTNASPHATHSSSTTPSSYGRGLAAHRIPPGALQTAAESYNHAQTDLLAERLSHTVITHRGTPINMSTQFLDHLPQSEPMVDLGNGRGSVPLSRIINHDERSTN